MTYPPALDATSVPELDAAQRAAVHAATLPGGAAPRPRALLGVGDAWHTLQNLTLMRATSVEQHSRWWEMHQADVDASPFATSLADGLQVVLVSDRLAGG